MKQGAVIPLCRSFDAGYFVHRKGSGRKRSVDVHITAGSRVYVSFFFYLLIRCALPPSLSLYDVRVFFTLYR